MSTAQVTEAELSHDRANWLRVAKERDEIKAERDSLRAEVERLNALGSWAHTCIHHTDEQRSRAERCPVCATAELARLRATIDAAMKESSK